MADIRERYEEHSIEEIIGACIDRGILVPPEALDDREALLELLRHDTNDAYAQEKAAEKLLLRSAPQRKAEELGGAAITASVRRKEQDVEALRKLRERKVRVVKNYAKPARKRNYEDFVKYFNKRYQALGNILRARKELQSVVSISRVIGKKERESVALIGIVLDKKESKSKHTILTLEDPTGTVEVWLSATNRELTEVAKEIVLDEVIGIVGQTAGNRIFANSVIFPDVPISKELKKGTADKYAIFIGDVHIGAKLFLKDEFEKLLLWLSGNVGTPEQREIAKKTEYVIFSGDLVEGIGIYPDQDQDLNIMDIKEQYAAFTRYLKMIPEEKQIIITAGNHDVGRLQEPQLPIPQEFAPELHEMPNVTIISNPGMVTIDQSPTHPGFDILVYHGYSLIYYANTIQPVRDAGGQKATEKIMQLLLKKRHLAPTHGCNTYVPDPEEDPMVIDRVPDFLITGHVHRISYANYRGVTMMNVGCWNEQSEEQEKRGLEPQPAKLPIVNLRTRELRIMNFYHNSEERKAQIRAEGTAAAVGDKPPEAKQSEQTTQEEQRTAQPSAAAKAPS